MLPRMAQLEDNNVRNLALTLVFLQLAKDLLSESTAGERQHTTVRTEKKISQPQ